MNKNTPSGAHDRLLIDLGNTGCKIAYARGREVGEMVRGDGREPLAFLKKELKDKSFNIIVLSSVQRFSPELNAWLETRTGKLIVVDGDTPTALKIDYQTPDRLGADRLAAGVGALTRYPGTDLLVIDFGTAITYDFISKEGRLLGGNISMGMQMRFNALHQFTQALPLITLVPGEEVPELGTDTRSAMVAGVVQGIVREVGGYISKNQNRKIIFTGGDAIFFAQELKTPIFVDCNLIFTGLAEIAQDHA